MASPKPTKVAILVFPETTASVVYGIYDLLQSAGRDWGVIVNGEPGPQSIQPILVSRHQDACRVSNQVQITPHVTLANCPPVDVILVPEVNMSPEEPLQGRFTKEIDWLKQRHAEGSILATACSGAILLAEAGLLDGQEATTHWAWCETLQKRYPAVKVKPHRALVVAGEGQQLIMAGGGTSWLDLALYLISRLTDVDTAMQVARINLIDWHHIGQQPFARLARTRQSEDAMVARCQEWIAENYSSSAPVSCMMQLSGLAERTFKRRFKSATGMSPIEYVHTLRLEEAKQMLEAENLPIEAIAAEVGYEDTSFFNRLFRRQVKLTPAQYRRRFKTMRKALKTGTGHPAD